MNFMKIFPIHQLVRRSHILIQRHFPGSIIYHANRQPVQIRPLIRSFSIQSRLDNDEDQDDVLDEDSYWNLINNDLDADKEGTEDAPCVIKEPKIKLAASSLLHRYTEKKVFILQLKMQYKSKARQSTTAELQMEESKALVETLNGWKVVDSLILGTKKVNTRDIFGSGNQELLAKRIPESGANCLFIVIDRLSNSQVKSLRENLLGNNPNIRIYDRYKIVLEIFKRNAHSSIAKLQIALAGKSLFVCFFKELNFTRKFD